MPNNSELRDVVESGDYNRLIGSVPYAQYLGISINTQSDQRIYNMPYQHKLLGNPERKLLHGGVTAGFVETAALLEVLIVQKQNRIPKPVDLSIDYLRPGKAQTCSAFIEMVREGNRIILARVDCQQDTQLIAQARIHFLLEPIQ